MNDTAVTEIFEARRPLLFAIAYRMLGSVMEAEDIVQEAYLRFQTAEPETVRAPTAFLRTVVTRLCLNHLASARAQREQYLGLWLPEPVRSAKEETYSSSSLSPAREVELHESLSLAFLSLLEQLTPLERAVFLLREVFDYSYAEIAAIVERDEAGCRQIFGRARKHISAHRPRFQVTVEQHQRLLSQFVQAVGSGGFEDLIRLLADDVVMWVDGGGKVRGAATRPLHGTAAVARFLLASTRYLPSDYVVEIAEVNSQMAAILRIDGRTVLLIALEIEKDLIEEIRVIGNPDKLHNL